MVAINSYSFVMTEIVISFVILLILYGWIEETKSKALKCLLYVLMIVELAYTPYHIKTTMENSTIECVKYVDKQPEPHLITEE